MRLKAHRYAPLSDAEMDAEQKEVLAAMAARRDVKNIFRTMARAPKALKGFLYARGAEQVLGHSVADLVAECATLDAAFGQLRPQAAPLDQYYVPTRYPNSLPGGIPAEAFDETDGRRALTLAGDVLALVRATLG